MNIKIKNYPQIVDDENVQHINQCFREILQLEYFMCILLEFRN